MCSAAPVAALQAAREVAQGTASGTRSLPAVTTAAPRHGQAPAEWPRDAPAPPMSITAKGDEGTVFLTVPSHKVARR